MTLRDHFGEVPALSPQAVIGPSTAQSEEHDHTEADEWALKYISVTYLRSIMEAFDDDASGYVTITEVNKLMDLRPPSLGWR